MVKWITRRLYLRTDHPGRRHGRGVPAAVVSAVAGFGGGVVLLPVFVALFGLRVAVPASPLPSWSRTAAGSPSTGTTSIVAWSGGSPSVRSRAPSAPDCSSRPLRWASCDGCSGVLLLVVVLCAAGSAHRPRLAPQAFVAVGAASALGSALWAASARSTAPFFLARGLVKEAYIGTEATSAVVLHAAKSWRTASAPCCRPASWYWLLLGATHHARGVGREARRTPDQRARVRAARSRSAWWSSAVLLLVGP